MDYKKAKKIYISGIGGIGVSALARFFIEQGAQVSGSDKTQSDICSDLQKAGVTVYYQQDKENVKDDIDLFIYSAAVPENNAERQKAKELGIEQKSYPEVLAEISVDYRTIAVSGTNGKSSTTAMLASALIEGEKDPTVILGSQYEKLDKNFRAGRSDLFLLEACEYRAHMLLLNPQTIIITNLEEEHLDFYRDINHIIQTFQQYIQKLKPNDFLIINNDDINLRELRLPNCRVVRFGLIEGAD
ncbi:MAG TPA: Mur ligase domain-containing protein, partial [Patescibacteria group bacterium]|nr:Mur ligase domain-containing protein [Patescibacteria group bacterium]